MDKSALLERARQWAAGDPDDATRDELRALLAAAEAEDADAQAVQALRERVGSDLQFGTAGLRGLVGAGRGRMNRAVVIRATHGLCVWLKEQVPDAAERGVCIGFDARPDSRRFAMDVAAVVSGAGLRALLFETYAPTPLVGFSVLHLGAAGGVVVTASHNPPEYNGYKVYWENGGQIVPPHDDGIAAAIAVAPPANEVPLRSGAHESIPDEVRRAYVEGVVRVACHPELPRDLTIAYTPLHGVGAATAQWAMRAAGFGEMHIVASQAEPDGAFPTVNFPNPEEPGALDALEALATEVGADIALANDPDADRLAALVKRDEGGYEALSGNDIGCLMAHYLLSEGRTEAVGEPRVVVNTVVSSPMLGAIAAAHGATWRQTLTGHKWIHHAAIQEEAAGRTFVLGYEEALGYAAGTLVRDKDGVSATVLFADMAAWCRSRGTTVSAERDAMMRRYGLYVSRQVSRVLAGPEGRAEIDALMARARELAAPGGLTRLAGHPVSAVVDGLARTKRSSSGPVTELSWVASDLIVFELDGGHRAMLRPSGTEPKLKFYYDVRAEVGDETVGSARARAEAMLDALQDALESTLA